MIGFDGGQTTGDIFGIRQEDFNRYVHSYNEGLRKAVSESAVSLIEKYLPDATGISFTFSKRIIAE